MDQFFQAFNKIYILESLPAGDYKTGQRLYEDLLMWEKIKNDDLMCEYKTIFDSSEFFSLLDQIANEARNNIYPMIHLEIHGCESGLKLSNGEYFEWGTLKEVLTKINIACRNNLFITLAVCNGAYLSTIISESDRAPFLAIIGLSVESSAKNLEFDFKSFYAEFLSSLDGDKALQKINESKQNSTEKYLFINCCSVFAGAYIRYINEHCRGVGYENRVKELLSIAVANGVDKLRSLDEIRTSIENAISDKNKLKTHFEKRKNKFFMIDLYPENESRFKIDFEKIYLSADPLH